MVKMSTICSPMVSTGLSEFMADWKTMATSCQRKRRSSSGLMARTSLPPKEMLPPAIFAGSFRSRMIELAMVDFPQPDSPASPKTSPVPMLKETRSTAVVERVSPTYLTVRSLTSRTGSWEPKETWETVIWRRSFR